MQQILKIEPFSGISGDMFLGALAQLLDAESDICGLPMLLGLEEVEVQFEDVIRSTLQCRKATVLVRGQNPEQEAHSHSYDHGPDDHHHHHAHRAYREIVAQIKSSPLEEGVKTRALDMFRMLGEAEAAMHGQPLEEVHFHEVGGEDALIDIVGAALLIDKLNPSATLCTPVCVGSGFVKTEHGRLPVPAPATQRLLEGMPTVPGPIAKEMTTPTGAVILKHLKPIFEIPVLVSTATGLGAGTRDPKDQPNALRVSLCHPPAEKDSEAIVLLQTNLDNLSGEDLGSDALQDLLDAGALDAWLNPVLMKKGRPGHLLEVLCPPGQADALTTHILTHLPTLGVRRLGGSRTILKRSSETVSTKYGDIALKVHHLPDGSTRSVPEYESLRAAVQTHGVSIGEVRSAISKASLG